MMAHEQDAPLEFRFSLGRLLGAGGMGVVYEAFDHRRGETVALKKLINTDPHECYRLKREFRTLADVAHPNLVNLHELFAQGEEWFFTMELIDGIPFTNYVRPTSARLAWIRDPDDSDVRPGALDISRLYEASRQLAEGVHALHEFGKLHLDLKPSNALVTHDGRVIILDFGFAADLKTERFRSDRGIAGTPLYMAPEQIRGEKATTASDWYAVGVMLYEAVTGQLPFPGGYLEVMHHKLAAAPRRAETLAPESCAEIARLATLLVNRDPERRPDGPAVLRSLGSRSPSVQTTRARPAGKHAFIGRHRELDALQSAYAHMRRDRTAVSVYLHGRSGIGKTAFVEEFLQLTEYETGAVVLTARCYDRESISYKALDGIIDSLTRYFKTIPSEKVEVYLPRDVAVVTRLFPALLRVDAVNTLSSAGDVPPDPLELRRRASLALRELLARLADRHFLILHIDDLHWADPESITLLQQIVAAPGAPAILVIAAFRTEEIEAKPFLQMLLQSVNGRDVRELELDQLPEPDARSMAHALLPKGVANISDVVETIVTEAGGSPFFIEQLARYASMREGSLVGTTLLDMVDAQLLDAPPGTISVLEALAVAGHPVEFGVAWRAAGADAELREIATWLRGSGLIKTSVTAAGIELYHDRIGEALISRLSAETVRSIHLQLAGELAADQATEPEVLFGHYMQAGETGHAAALAIQTADRAAAALAFDRAARFYRVALNMRGASNDSGSLLERLANALANAGRPRESAEAFALAARVTTHFRSLELKRAAAEQLLIGGYYDEGLEIIRDLVKDVGLRMPSSRIRVIAGLLLLRLKLKLRGFKFVERSEDIIPEAELRKVDVCHSCAFGLAFIDVVTASYFQAHFLLSALRAGEPSRIARALAFEAAFIAVPHGTNQRTEDLLQEAESICLRITTPRARAQITLSAAGAACVSGEFRRSVEAGRRAEAILRNECIGEVWELTAVHIYIGTSLYYMGEIAELMQRVENDYSFARERGNIFEMVEVTTRHHSYWLFRDRPEEGRQELRAALARWTRSGFFRQHHNSLLAECNIDLYCGNAVAAYQTIEEFWPVTKRGLNLQMQILRLEALHLRARCALAATVESRDENGRVAQALSFAKRILREQARWANPLGHLIEAGAAMIEGNSRVAVRRLETAAVGFDHADMKLYAAVARHRLGSLVGGERGESLMTDASAFMTNQGIVSPAKIVALLAPGFPNA